MKIQGRKIKAFMEGLIKSNLHGFNKFIIYVDSLEGFVFFFFLLLTFFLNKGEWKLAVQKIQAHGLDQEVRVNKVKVNTQTLCTNLVLHIFSVEGSVVIPLSLWSFSFIALYSCYSGSK